IPIQSSSKNAGPENIRGQFHPHCGRPGCSGLAPFARATTILILISFVYAIGLFLELSHLKLYSKFNSHRRSYAALKTRSNVLPVTANGDAGSSGETRVR